MVLLYCLDWSVRQSIHLIVHAHSSTSSRSLPSPLLRLSPLSPPSQHSQTSHLSPCYTSLHPFTHLLHHITLMLHHCNTLLHFRYTLLHPCRRLFINDVTTFWGDLDSPLPLVFMSCKWSSRKNRPLAHDHQERLAACKWSSRKQAYCKWSLKKPRLLQMIIQRIRPLANDHHADPASCNWLSGGTILLQMIIP